MSNLELVARFNAASERRDEAELERLIAPDSVWDMSRSRGPYSGVYHGHDEIRPLLEGLVDAWDEMRVARVSAHERGNWVAEEVEVSLKGRGSGMEVVARGARVYEFRDGKLTRFALFQDFEAAREYVDANA